MKTRKRWLTVFLLAVLCLSSCTGKPTRGEPAPQAEPEGEQENAQTQKPTQSQPAGASAGTETVPDLTAMDAGSEAVRLLCEQQLGPVTARYYAINEDIQWVAPDTLLAGADLEHPQYYSVGNGAMAQCPATRYAQELELYAYGEDWNVLFDCWQTEGGLRVRNLAVGENQARVSAFAERSQGVLLRAADGKLAVYGLWYRDVVPVVLDMPEGVDAVLPNGSGSHYLLHAQDGWYLDWSGRRIAQLSDAAGPVRWRGEETIVYDVENPETGRLSTFCYDVEADAGQMLLADYMPYPAAAEGERVLLVKDAYALRLAADGAAYLRALPDGAEQPLAGLNVRGCTLEAGNGELVFCRRRSEADTWRQLGFIDCAAGACTLWNRETPEGLHEENTVLCLGETAIGIKAAAATASGVQSYLLVYSMERPHGVLVARLSEQLKQLAARNIGQNQLRDTDEAFAPACERVAEYLAAQGGMQIAQFKPDQLGAVIVPMDKPDTFLCTIFRKDCYDVQRLKITPAGVQMLTQEARPAVPDSPGLAALLNGAQMGAGVEDFLYDICQTEEERKAFLASCDEARQAFGQYLYEHPQTLGGAQPEALSAQLLLLADYSFSLQLYRARPDELSSFTQLYYTPGLGVWQK